MRNGWSPEVKFLESLRSRSVIVFGAGVTGSSTARFLESAGARVMVIDESPATDARSDLSGIDFDNYDLAIASPGWKLNQPLIEITRQAGIEILSEIDLAWRLRCELAPDQRWLGITGTNGKTTTVQMAAAMLREAGRSVKACGNVGDPVVDAVLARDSEFLVIELSSFQLAWSHELELSAGVILNIADDHLDWHGDFDAYASAKFKLAQLSGTLIANADDKAIRRRLGAVTNRLITYTLNTPAPHQLGLVENLAVDRAFISGDAQALFELSDVQPAVPHNVANALAAAALVRSVGVTGDSIAAALRNFKIDHHRLETVRVKDGITWIDDSKATNPHAALAALRSQLKSIWIAGGLSKGADMNELVRAGTSRMKCAILIGTDAPVIEAALRTHAPSIPITRIDDELAGIELMRKVVAVAASQAAPGDTVLLAPACASMDRFKNYGERGDLFAAAIQEFYDGK